MTKHVKGPSIGSIVSQNLEEGNALPEEIQQNRILGFPLLVYLTFPVREVRHLMAAWIGADLATLEPARGVGSAKTVSKTSMA